jgi:signal transduction histidine kinase
VWSALVLAGTGWGLDFLFRGSVEAAFDRELAASVDALAASVDGAADGNLIVPRSPPDPRFSRPLSGRYWRVMDVTADGRFGAGSVSSRSLWDETLTPAPTLVASALAAPGVTQAADMRRGPEQLRLAVRVVQLPDRPTPTLLLVAADSVEIAQAANRFTFTLVAALIALTVGLLAAILLQVRLGLAPLRRMGEDLADIRAGRRERLDDGGPEELAPLARELNALISHNQAVVERSRTHVGNLAHALKTPLSVILNETGARDDRLSKLVADQTLTMSRQVEHYLKRASAAARAETLGARAEVAPVVDDLTRTLARLYRGDGVKVLSEVVGAPVFRGEREDLEDMIGNLAENACKYGGGLVEIHAARTEAGRLCVLIDDDGDGLSDAEARAALKRGARLDESAPGSGLGLSICADLAQAYGGALHLEASPAGGVRARLDLPAADV